MAITPGQSSGTYLFSLSNSSLIGEAFDRCKIRPVQIDRHRGMSARTSLNLELSDWSNSGLNLWKVVSGTINLTTDATYVMDQSIQILTDVYYTQVNGNGPGQNNDRFMVPITRDQYLMIPNKLTPGSPTQYWFQMLAIPQITVYSPPMPGQIAPTYVISWYGLQRMQDANIGGGETPDVVYRAYEALCARMALRLWTKFGMEASNNDAQAFTVHRAVLKEEATDAWNNFQTRDQEAGPLLIQPAAGAYGRID